MRFRTMKTSDGWVLQVEGGDEVLVVAPLVSPDNSAALKAKALAEGIDAIRPVEAKKKATKK